jgi:hypothetical protein
MADINTVIESYADYLSARKIPLWRRFQKTRRDAPESAMAEAAIFRVLQQCGAEPEVADMVNKGGPDFRCVPRTPGQFMVEATYAQAGLSRQPRLGALNYGDFQAHGDDLNADLKEFAVSLDLIRRLGIIVEEVTTEPIDLGKITSQIKNKTLRSKLDVDSKTRYMFSALGRQFMNACQKPPKAS